MGARHRGVSLAAVQRKIKRGIVPTVITGSGVKIPQEKADRLWATFTNFLAPQSQASLPVSRYQLQYQKAKADVMELRLQMARAELDREKAQLLDANEVKKRLQEISDEVRQKFSELPILIGPKLLAAKNEHELSSILYSEIEKILINLSEKTAK